MKKRIIYLDILKTIAIFFVCSYHFSWVGNCAFDVENMNITTYFNRFFIGIWSTCMPLFFMVNGALMLNKSELNYKKHFYKIISLAIAFFVWRGITIVILGSNVDVLKSSGIRNVVDAIIFGRGLPGVDTAHFWFIPVLISVYIVSPFIYEIYSERKEWINIFMIIALVGCFLFNDIGNVLRTIPAFRESNFGYFNEFVPFKGMNFGMLFYFVLGGWLHRDREKLSCISTGKLLIVFFIGEVWLFVEWFLISKDKGSNWDSVFNGYISVATLFMSISVYLLVCKYYKKIERCKKISACFEIIGNNTLGIYYLHWIIGYTLLAYIRQNYIVYDGIFLNYIKSFVMILVIAFTSQKIKKIPVIRKII